MTALNLMYSKKNKIYTSQDYKFVMITTGDGDGEMIPVKFFDLDEYSGSPENGDNVVVKLKNLRNKIGYFEDLITKNIEEEPLSKVDLFSAIFRKDSVYPLLVKLVVVSGIKYL